MNSPQNIYGFRYFDKRADYEEEEENEEYGTRTCSAVCCDNDCECDDCERCSLNGNEPAAAYDADAA